MTFNNHFTGQRNLDMKWLIAKLVVRASLAISNEREWNNFYRNSREILLDLADLLERPEDDLLYMV